MSNNNIKTESAGLVKNGPSADKDESTKMQSLAEGSIEPSSEDDRVESLAREALAETIRDGGAFAGD